MPKVIVVIGGIGSQATVDLFGRTVRTTPTQCDQDHLHFLIDMYSQTPDRQAAVLGRGPDLTPPLLESVRRLEKVGAELRCMACNSAHIFLLRFAHKLSARMLDMISLTAQALSKCQPPINRAGLLASGLYQQHCVPLGIEIPITDRARQEATAASMCEVERGDTSPRTRVRLVTVAEEVITRGARTLVLACTELPLVPRQGNVRTPVIDPTQILAKAVAERGLM
jgi:aspartate racemase